MALFDFRMRRICAVISGVLILGVGAGRAQEPRAAAPGGPIDRRALVSRHNVTWTDPLEVMPLGNGEFCFNADGTGLQTFGGNTMAHWAWHSFPMPPGWTPDQVPVTGSFQKGRPVGGDEFPPGTALLRDWMRHNPHGLNLGRLRLHWSDGRDVALGDISHLSCHLDLWTGWLASSFDLDGQPVRIETCVHPGLDAVVVRIESPLLASGKLEVALDFPYPALKNGLWENGAWAGDFTVNDAHNLTSWTRPAANEVDFVRQVDATTYHTRIAWSAGKLQEHADKIKSLHYYTLAAPGQGAMEFTCAYSSRESDVPLPSFSEGRSACAARWETFWQSGGAIDFSGSRDSRWFELERRVVLSQYQMAAQSAGSFPPAEIGLMGIDPWGSRFHMEMTWWHLAHYALWDRWSMAERALGCYQRFLPVAESRARQLDLKGAAWPKGVGPDGISQPWVGNVALLWKEPHPIFFAELDYRLHPTRATLEKWAGIVQQTAEYMASYPALDPQSHLYSLVPDMPPSEQGLTVNTPFDLAYWRWGLDAAQRWRERLGLPREPHWEDVRRRLAPLPVEDGVFTLSPQWHDTYTERNRSHPDPIGVFGMLPPIEGVDSATAHRTLLKIWKTWDWNQTWGWDYPWVAMAAARMGEPRIALEALLKQTPKNGFDWRGVNTGAPCPYLPGNGGLLYAVAMMAAGWDGAPERPAPGFPDDGSWAVRWEGLKKAP